MEIPKTYNPSESEDKWYKYWMDEGFFRSVPDEREPYTIVIPPPNVTGVLHMGHMLNNTIQDVLIRRARMQGKNACWVPGTDHASIATEAKVVAMLREKGIKKSDLTREQFLAYAWEWNEKYGGIILEQLKKLGASCDWERTRFTMEPDLYESVIDVFIDLYEKGYIYRGNRMVNWDPVGKTAVSDEEVIHKEVDSFLYHVKYRVEGEEDNYITIATTRPETILGDTAVCVHPADERYRELHGRNVIVPLVKRVVPIIRDEYVSMEFGTGALKITPAHDVNDYELGKKHDLATVDILTEDGKLSPAAEHFVGMDRFEAREAVAKKLDEEGFLVLKEPYKNNVGYSERTNAVIEPRLSMQWFLKMKDISRPALENVMNDEVQLVPDKFKNTYRHWMENVHDWCISRQLWWGHRIPAWYAASGEFVVARSESEARDRFNEIKNINRKEGTEGPDLSEIRQDEDVMDTWFSSWLWPISVFDGIRKPDNEDINYYYPTNDLVTAPEILFFWVARMIIAGYEYRDEKPFSNVYLTGIVRDKLGRKMSKSLGNSPEPLELIEKYGADGVRVGMLLSSPAGNDLLFDEGLCEQGRNFCNKIWNSFRLVNSWKNSDETETDQTDLSKVLACMNERLSSQIAVINDHYSKYRMSDALMTTYKLVWDDYCSWYLELVKPRFGYRIQEEVLNRTLDIFEDLLKILHPLVPFISEEIWQRMKQRSRSESLIISQWPEVIKTDTSLTGSFELMKLLVTEIRNLRKSANIPMKQEIRISFKKGQGSSAEVFHNMVIKLCKLESIEEVKAKPDGVVSMIIGGHEYYAHTLEHVNTEDEIKKVETELDYTRNFLSSVMKKLNNEKFVNNAKPEVVELERKKKNDAEEKIRILQETLDSLHAN